MRASQFYYNYSDNYAKIRFNFRSNTAQAGLKVTHEANFPPCRSTLVKKPYVMHIFSPSSLQTPVTGEVFGFSKKISVSKLNEKFLNQCNAREIPRNFSRS